MELIIKVDKELYEAYKGKPPMLGDAGMDMIAQAIANGIPLPIRVHNHWNKGDMVELEVNGERHTVKGSELISAINRCMLNIFGE